MPTVQSRPREHPRRLFRAGDEHTFITGPRHILYADAVLRTRLSEAIQANIDRRLVDHVKPLRDVLGVLEGLVGCSKQDIPGWLATLSWAAQRAIRRFEMMAKDAAAVAAVYELTGLADAISALDAAVNGCRRKIGDPFPYSVPADRDPIAGPQIRARVALWNATP
jgi:hypothetical protein